MANDLNDNSNYLDNSYIIQFDRHSHNDPKKILNYVENFYIKRRLFNQFNSVTSKFISVSEILEFRDIVLEYIKYYTTILKDTNMNILKQLTDLKVNTIYDYYSNTTYELKEDECEDEMFYFYRCKSLKECKDLLDCLSQIRTVIANIIKLYIKFVNPTDFIDAMTTVINSLNISNEEISRIFLLDEKTVLDYLYKLSKYIKKEENRGLIKKYRGYSILRTLNVLLRSINILSFINDPKISKSLKITALTSPGRNYTLLNLVDSKDKYTSKEWTRDSLKRMYEEILHCENLNVIDIDDDIKFQLYYNFLIELENEYDCINSEDEFFSRIIKEIENIINDTERLIDVDHDFLIEILSEYKNTLVHVEELPYYGDIYGVKGYISWLLNNSIRINSSKLCKDFIKEILFKCENLNKQTLYSLMTELFYKNDDVLNKEIEYIIVSEKDRFSKFIDSNLIFIKNFINNCLFAKECTRKFKENKDEAEFYEFVIRKETPEGNIEVEIINIYEDEIENISSDKLVVLMRKMYKIVDYLYNFRRDIVSNRMNIKNAYMTISKYYNGTINYFENMIYLYNIKGKGEK